jgi:hypothetical protein
MKLDDLFGLQTLGTDFVALRGGALSHLATLLFLWCG